MTRAQAEEVLSVGRATIAAWVQKLTPTAGQNAVVDGNAVTLMKQPVAPAPEHASTWVWRLFATAERTLEVDGEEVTNEEIDAGVIARVIRTTLFLVAPAGVIESLTQMFDIPAGEFNSALKRYFTLNLTARGIEPTDPVDVTSGFTPPDVVLTFEEYVNETGQPEDVVQTHVMRLSNGTASQRFQSTNTNQTTSLRLASVTRASP